MASHTFARVLGASCGSAAREARVLREPTKKCGTDIRGAMPRDPKKTKAAKAKKRRQKAEQTYVRPRTPFSSQLNLCFCFNQNESVWSWHSTSAHSSSAHVFEVAR